MKRVFIDTDPGIDDALAILLAHQMGLDIEGICLVSGNVPRDQGLINVFRLAHFLGRDFKIYRESTGPLVYPLNQGDKVHGEDGLGDTQLAYEDLPYEDGGADKLLGLLKEGPLTIFALGPLTNLAVALKKDREAFKNAKLVVMGGNVYVPGNVTKTAEFNFWCDPHGAQYVFDHFPGYIDLVALDITRYCLLDEALMDELEEENPRLGAFIKKISKAYLDTYERKDGIKGCILHDPLTLLVDKYQDLFDWEDLSIKVLTEEDKRGQVELVPGGQKNCRLYTQVDPKVLMGHFKEEMLGRGR